MAVFVDNIETLTENNTNYRQVLHTGTHSQLVIMCLQPSQDIGMEIHEEHDQFIRVESGQGVAVLDGKEFSLTDGFAVVIRAGVEHNIINTSTEDLLKLYTIYSPPEHPDGTIQKSKPENSD